MFGHRSFLVLGGSAADILSLITGGYEVANCEFTMEQGIDDTGKASTVVRGGTLAITLPMVPPTSIIEWALDSRKYKSGIVVTLDANNIPMSKIAFNNAMCINMGVDYRQKGDSYTVTSIVIQAEKLLFGAGVNFDNEWTEQ